MRGIRRFDESEIDLKECGRTEVDQSHTHTTMVMYGDWQTRLANEFSRRSSEVVRVYDLNFCHSRLSTNKTRTAYFWCVLKFKNSKNPIFVCVCSSKQLKNKELRKEAPM